MGYWNKPEETALVMTPDNFLRTRRRGQNRLIGFL